MSDPMLTKILSKAASDIEDWEWTYLHDHDLDAWDRKIMSDQTVKKPAPLQDIYRQKFGYDPPERWDPQDATWRKPALIESWKPREETFYGYICRWNMPSLNEGHHIYAPNCFAEFLRSESEVACIASHEFSRGVLCWRSNGTLHLEEDRLGLFFSARIPGGTKAANELWESTLKLESLGCSIHASSIEQRPYGNAHLCLRAAIFEVSILPDSQHGAIAGSRCWYRRLGAPIPPPPMKKERPVVRL